MTDRYKDLPASAGGKALGAAIGLASTTPAASPRSPRYDEPYAHHWFEKQITGPAR